MKLKENVVKGYITSLIGLVVCYITYKQIDAGNFGFVWEGIAGFGLGITLILAPDDFVKTIKGIATKFKESEKETKE